MLLSKKLYHGIYRYISGQIGQGFQKGVTVLEPMARGCNQ